MTLGETIKYYRTQLNLSQTELGDRIGVSRQAVTKWETDTGIPDINNIQTLAKVFHISIDTLLSSDHHVQSLYESKIEYDIDVLKDFDINLGTLGKVDIEGYEGEKLIITLSSSIYKDLKKDFKIKLDENKARLDIDLETKEYITKDQRRDVNILILLPLQYIHKLECSVLPTSMSVSHIHSDSIELDIKTSSLNLMDISGHIEIDCNIDMVITIDAVHGKLDLNSVRCSSQLNITSSCLFNTITKGIKTKIIYAGDIDEDSDNQIELNGIMSELVIKAD
ncbi:helix-turn-helix transcriptional regulator [Coprobacillus sp. K06]|uniref:helix-turn-helix domain-containing protein n=1 Tax=Coprobacillus sp. K06 TaxID=2718930 RepID=UPI001C8B8D57|nr:helix-turn-helix transcriptional regulator [Coprobacillus sp. K06]MBX9164645.1 helix-turn-helix transcriptional regulator [Coprobacillus sp. K06]